MIEYERRFQLRILPANLAQWAVEHVEDQYFPATQNPQLRLRREGDRYMLTKKRPLNGQDLSEMSESTIALSKAEYSFLNARLGGRVVRKSRHRRDTEHFRLEVAEFLPPLAPLIILDVEHRRRAGPPTDHELADALQLVLAEFEIVREVTQDPNLAGGKLAGKAFSDLDLDLA